MASFFFALTSYHVGSLNRQRSDPTLRLLQQVGVSRADCVLDVGCGAGQTLRLVREIARHALLIAVDPDSAALVAGARDAGDLCLVRGVGERLPLADSIASHVICRVAVNYMYQERALSEILRVMKPGGTLVMTAHAFGYNLKQVLLPHKGGLRQRLGNMKDLIAGLLLQFFGWQGQRGSFWGKAVPHTSTGRLRRQLRQAGPVRIVRHRYESRFLGMDAILWTIMVKVA